MSKLIWIICGLCSTATLGTSLAANTTSNGTPNSSLLFRILNDRAYLLGGLNNGQLVDAQHLKLGQATLNLNIDPLNTPSTWSPRSTLDSKSCAGAPFLAQPPAKSTAGANRDVLAYTASFNALPRKATALSVQQAAYQRIAQDYLKSQGMYLKTVSLSALYRVDLNNDKQDEIVMVLNGTAQRKNVDTTLAQTSKLGQYSAVLVRQLVQGKVVTRALGEFLLVEPTGLDYSARYDLGGFLDLDNDGKLEIVLNNSVYDGTVTRVFQEKNQAWKSVLRWGVGMCMPASS